MEITPASPPPPRPFHCLSSAELAERRRHGLCYSCVTSSIPHKCQRLFYLEVTDPDDARTPDTEDSRPAMDTPVLSLHAMTGICTEAIMQLHYSIANQQFVALLDSGSSHNFIHPVVARQASLAFHSSAGAHITVANGDRVACQGLARDVAIHLGAAPFSIDCYFAPLDSFDMVLVATFLHTLGPILWDFDNSCIAFWRGLGSPCPSVPVTSHLNVVHDTAPARLGRPTTVAGARSHSAAAGSRRSAPSTPFFINIIEDLRRDSQHTANLRNLRDLFVTASGEPSCVVDGLILRDALVLVPASSATSATILQLTHTTGNDGPQTALQTLC